MTRDAMTRDAMTRDAMTRDAMTRDATAGCARIRPHGGLRTDRGTATVLACFGVMALVAFALLALQLGTAVVAREQAETAADLGALAGAAVVLNGADSACRVAATVAGSNGGALDNCTLQGADVLVAVTVDVTFGPVTRHAQARARAGPTARQSP